MKLNSFSDFKMIDLFYQASNAGVQIELIVRGICCLIPGVEGIQVKQFKNHKLQFKGLTEDQIETIGRVKKLLIQTTI